MARRRTVRTDTAAATMTTGEAAVAALLAHGLDTIYVLPGVHNDDFFDALAKNTGRIRTVHSRHEQGAAYMALGAAVATGRPQAYCVVPGPGLLNSSAALLTAYGMNAPVLALFGQIPQKAIGRGLATCTKFATRPASSRGWWTGRRRSARHARRRAWSPKRSRPCSRAGRVRRRWNARSTSGGGQARCRPRPAAGPRAAHRRGRHQGRAKRLGAAKRPLIVAGGGAQDASPEVTALAHELQAPVLSYRRGRGVLDDRDPLSVNLPLGRELWREADVVLAVGTHLHTPLLSWGTDRDLSIIRVDADPDAPARIAKPKVALVGQAAPILRRLLAVLPAHNSVRPSRTEDMRARHALMNARLAKLAPQLAYLGAIRAELPEDGIFVDEVTQLGFASRLAFPVYRPRTFISPGYQDNLGYGFATALGVQDARRDVPVVSITGDGGFLFTATEMATAMRHRIPLVTVFSTTAHSATSGASRRNATATADRQRPRQSRFCCFRQKLRRQRRAGAWPGRTAGGAAARFRGSGQPHPDRSPGGPHAKSLGIHPDATRARGLGRGRRGRRRRWPLSHFDNESDHDNVRACGRVPANGLPPLRDRRHRISAGKHLLSAVVHRTNGDRR